MATIVDGEHPRVSFSETERNVLLEKAKVRSEEGTAFRMDLHPYSEAEAKALNRVGNHIAGELSERAVSAWLDTHGVENKRPGSLREELEEKLPDIATILYGVKLDVKTSYFTPNEFRAKAAQARASAADAIVWCKAVREGLDSPAEFDSRVHEQAEVWGWTLLADMRTGRQVGDDLVVDSRLVRPLSRLLAWVKDGAAP